MTALSQQLPRLLMQDTAQMLIIRSWWR